MKIKIIDSNLEVKLEPEFENMIVKQFNYLCTIDYTYLFYNIVANIQWGDLKHKWNNELAKVNRRHVCMINSVDNLEEYELGIVNSHVNIDTFLIVDKNTDKYALSIDFRHGNLDNLKDKLSGNTKDFNMAILNREGSGITIEASHRDDIMHLTYESKVNSIDGVVDKLSKIKNAEYIHFNTNNKNIIYKNHKIEEIAYVLNYMSEKDKANEVFVCENEEIRICDICKQLAVLKYTDVNLGIINSKLSKCRLLLLDGIARFEIEQEGYIDV